MKVDNTLVSGQAKRPHIKICDFGFSKVCRAVHAVHAVLHGRARREREARGPPPG
jgi:hypothetical protein